MLIMPRSPLRLAIPSFSAAWSRSGKGVPALVLCAALSVLTACGQKGPLYLPRDPAPKATPPAADPGNTLGIVGLILAIIPCSSTIGMVLSIVAYIVSRRAGYQNSKALAGIIIGAAWLVIGLILQITMGLISGFAQMN